MPPLPEEEALRALLQDEDAEDDAFEEKISAYQAAKTKRQKELEAAREELADKLSKRQQAQLLIMGILE